MDHMPPVSENRTQPADPPRVNDCDILAEAYTAENEASLINAYYARPAILALAGDVAGRRVLDAGCGSGPLFAALRDRGAIVTGFDSSTGMLEQARQRLGDGADLRVAFGSVSSANRTRCRKPARCSPTSSRPCRDSCASCSSSCTPTNCRAAARSLNSHAGARH
jgi:SAM-dependent methyltransferase